jgi:hypothetical protein
VHQRIAAKKEKMRADQFAATGVRQKEAEKEAVEKQFDRPAIILPATEDDEITQ